MRPAWDDIWMGLAVSLAERSTCSRSKVGCVVVSRDNQRVCGIGYNGNYRGGPNSCDDPNAVGSCGCLHSEDNCLIKTDFYDPQDKVVYVTMSPCVACSKRLVNACVSEVVYLQKYRTTGGLEIMRKAGIRVRKYKKKSI